MNDVWSDEEIALLYTDMSNQEIEQRTGRSKAAVRKKRYQKTHHYVEFKRQRDLGKLITPKPFISEYNKQARIIALAQKLGGKAVWINCMSQTRILGTL